MNDDAPYNKDWFDITRPGEPHERRQHIRTGRVVYRPRDVSPMEEFEVIEDAVRGYGDWLVEVPGIPEKPAEPPESAKPADWGTW